jgi:hypothetical protein
MIERRLSEMYVRSIVSESVAPAKVRREVSPDVVQRGNSRKIVQELISKHNLLDDTDDEAPRRVRAPSSPLLDDSNPLKSIYEGTRPLDEVEADGISDIPLDMIGLSVIDPERLKRAAGI